MRQFISFLPCLLLFLPKYYSNGFATINNKNIRVSSSSTFVLNPPPNCRHATTTTTTRRSSSSSGGVGLFMSSPLGLFGGGSGGRPMISENDLAEPPDSRVISVVEQMGSNQAVIASDVAAKAGISLSKARKSLSSLAALTNGNIAVSPSGDLIYSFPSSNISSVLSSNSARYRLTKLWKKDIWPKLFYGLRVGFGVVLLTSLFLIFSTIFVVLSSGGGSDDDRDDRDDRGGDGMRMGRGGGFGPLDFFYPGDFFYYRPYGYYGYYGRTPFYYRSRNQQQRQQEERKPNMLENVFSYIFGDGNPNVGLDNARLIGAATIIRRNGGAVTAEQLAPFCGGEDGGYLPKPDPDVYYGGSSGSSFVDESYVLPIVSQLGGEPQVTENGDIIYVFPELQLSAESTLEPFGLTPQSSTREILDVIRRQTDLSVPRGAVEKKDLIKKLEDTLLSSSSYSREEEEYELVEEQEIPFNTAGEGSNLLSGTLGAVNLGGALYLGRILSSPAMVGVRLPSYFGFVQSIYPLLLLYAIFFNVIPLVRNFINKSENEKIRERNAVRKMWVKVLGNNNKGGVLRRKLDSAKDLGRNMKRLGRDDAVYDTGVDALEMEKKREVDALGEFDKLLMDDDFDDNSAFQ